MLGHKCHQLLAENTAWSFETGAAHMKEAMSEKKDTLDSMVETAKKLLQLGKKGVEGGGREEKVVEKMVEKQETKRKRHSLASLMMSSSRIFSEVRESEGREEKREEKWKEGREEEGREDEGREAGRLFTPRKGKSRRISLRGKGGRGGGMRMEGHLSCPDLGELQRQEEGRGRGRRLVERIKGRREGQEQEQVQEQVDTVDSRTAIVFRETGAQTQLIDINFE